MYSKEHESNKFKKFANWYCFRLQQHCFRLNIAIPTLNILQRDSNYIWKSFKHIPSLISDIEGDNHEERFTFDPNCLCLNYKPPRVVPRNPKQEKLQAKISELKYSQKTYQEMTNLLATRNIDGDDYIKYTKLLQEVTKKLITAEATLKRLQRNLASVHRYRHRLKDDDYVVQKGVIGRRRKVLNLPRIIQTVVEQLSPIGAHARRHDGIVLSPISVSKVHRTLKTKGYNISRSTVNRALKASHRRRRAAARHYSDTILRLGRSLNTEGNYDEKYGHYTSSSWALIKHIVSTLPKGLTFVVGYDEKKKASIFSNTVDISGRSLHPLNQPPRKMDHDFDGAFYKVKINVVACAKIKNRKLSFKHINVFLRSEEFGKEQIFSDLKTVFDSSQYTGQPIVILQSDNAQDVAPNNAKVQLRNAILFINLKLDILVHHSHCAGASRLNFAELAMGPLSNAMSLLKNIGCTERISGPSDMKEQADMKEAFDAAMGTLKIAFEDTIVNKCPLKVQVTPYGASESNLWFQEKELAKISWSDIELYFEGNNDDDEMVRKIDLLVKFHHDHSVRGNGMNMCVLRKCSKSTCKHCSDNPIRSDEYFALMEKWKGWIPFPRPSTEREGHYMDLDELLCCNDRKVRVDEHNPIKKPLGKCEECGRTYFSIAERKRHEDTHWVVVEEDDKETENTTYTTTNKITNKDLNISKNASLSRMFGAIEKQSRKSVVRVTKSTKKKKPRTKKNATRYGSYK